MSVDAGARQPAARCCASRCARCAAACAASAVFIACIALGVAAIAGVGSFARSLADGLAREGRVILGGDVSFSLMPARGERAPSAPSSTDSGRRLGRRHHAGDGARRRRRDRAGRDQGGRRRLSAVRQRRARTGGRSRRRAGASATALTARPSIRRCSRGSISNAGARITRRRRPRSSCAPCCKSEPDKLAGGIGFGPRLLISEAALRATGLVQPGSLVRWHYRLRIPGADANDRAAHAVVAAAETQLARRRLGGAHARQRLARARPQHRALHAVSHAGRPDRAAGRRRRRRQCGEALSRPHAAT